MNRVGLVLFLTGWLLFAAKGQELRWSHIVTVEVEGLDQISLDNRGNLFYSDKGGNVFKLTGKGKLESDYSPSFQGKLHQLDAFWPSYIFLFSPDLQKITFLDVFLRPITIFSIRNDQIGRIGTASLGSRQVVWIFDEIGGSLIQYDYLQNEMLQKQSLFHLLDGEDIEVRELLERQNLLFMNVKKQGVLIFDNHGAFIKKLAIDLDQKLSIYKDHLYYIEAGNIHQVNFITDETSVLTPPEHFNGNILMGADKVVFYTDSSIAIYDPP